MRRPALSVPPPVSDLLQRARWRWQSVPFAIQVALAALVMAVALAAALTLVVSLARPQAVPALVAPPHPLPAKTAAPVVVAQPQPGSRTPKEKGALCTRAVQALADSSATTATYDTLTPAARVAADRALATMSVACTPAQARATNAALVRWLAGTGPAARLVVPAPLAPVAVP